MYTYVCYTLCILMCVIHYVYLCVLICVYYSNCIAIMSNICDRTDTCTCTYYFILKYMRLCIVCVVV